MNNPSYLSETLFNRKVFGYAAITAYKHLMWPMCFIGLPLVLFGLEGNMIEQITFFLGMSFVFFIPYLVLCFTMHRFSLKSQKQKESFLALDPIERGKIIGDELSGWW
ncbi:hypothetical protein EXT48_10450 [Pseudoalteromonas sp. CO348]|uniref:hypothetical protein n=1 Tax=Pseudoalteromonas TaxID=53246 RepID=UPI0005FA4C58|nr:MULTISPECIES: hypothetical protein [Pseudoalteromonas]KJZ02925.1 hypothetical protein TW73_10690 [Pseudoalteromonas piscicida]MCG7538705.1 hypothetical protein [Pseudoalteromonas sp. OF7H-1]RZG04767.1 hypothetical protein EXT48_10450 [Pseudoalteromonas sp. CO348]